MIQFEGNAVQFYQISSEDAAFALLIKAEITSLLINFDQARVSVLAL